MTFTPNDTLSYGPTTAAVTINVLRAPLTITGVNAGKVYGAAVPALAASYGGFVNGDTAASLDTPVSLGTTATAASSVGSYVVNASGAADANYVLTFASGLLNVTPATLTVTADNKGKLYGAAIPTLTASYAGFVNGDTVASLDTAVSLTTTATSGSSVGNYAVNVSSAADVNYAIMFVTGSLAVNPASLTIRADDKSRPFGSGNPALTATYTGFVNGDAATALDSPVVLATTAGPGSPEGTYPITASGAADLNYVITHVNGTLTVQPDTALPAPWLHQDVGAVALAGNAAHLTGTFTVAGSGADIWNNADGFHFTYQPWTGNGEIVARVTGVGNTDPWAKAGVMFRETLTAGSRHAMMVITPGNGSAFQRRLTTDGVSTHTAGLVVAAPYWVKLTRTGDTFTGYVSNDGVAWTLVGTETMVLPAGGFIGLAVTAHNNTVLSTSTFTAVQLGTPVVPPTVILTSPTGGATFTAPASIGLAATVTANGNVISKVEFLNGSTVIGEDTTAPYAFNWSGVGAGGYALVARVVYGAASVTSATASVTVNPAPTPPSAPVNLTATAASSTQINLAWTAGSANQTGFKIERSPNGTTFAQIATTAANVTTFNDTGLSAATRYYYRVSATNAQGDSLYSNAADTTTLAFAIVKINFQPASAAVPAGYLADGGSVFGNRGNGYSYGWNIVNTANARDRNSTRSLDQRYDTLNLTQKSGGGSVWEIAVPNGSYQVLVVAGDASNFNSAYQLNVEGVLTVSGTPTTANRWISGTKTVTVSDGRLTVSNGAGANNNKLCFIDITPVGAGGGAAAVSTPAIDPNARIIVGWQERTDDGRITLRVDGLEGASYEIQVSSDLKTWEPLGTAPTVDGAVTFDDRGTVPAPQRFYRVRLLEKPVKGP